MTLVGKFQNGEQFCTARLSALWRDWWAQLERQTGARCGGDGDFSLEALRSQGSAVNRGQQRRVCLFTSHGTSHTPTGFPAQLFT